MKQNNLTENITDDFEHSEYNEQNIYNTEKGEKFEKLKILFEKYLLSFHNELLKYLPLPYDYLLMFALGYFFMRLFTNGKSSINIKNKKKLVDMNVFQIEKKLKEISLYQKKLEEKNKGNVKPKQIKQNLIKLPKEIINLEKMDQIENKLNILMNDLNERNKDNSNERTLQNNICDLEQKIMEEISKKKAEEAEEEEGEEEEEEKEKEENNK